jgi:DNA-binding LacI/PurR family transcriptional regulator
VCDNIAGGRALADLLLDAGHLKLAYIAGREDSSTNRDREHGFKQRLLERGIAVLLREAGAYTYDSGFQAAQRLLKRRHPPSAIFCANDITAMGAIDAAREQGVRVPHDLSVVGFDDIPAAAWSAYRLTTVQQPVALMIETSIQLLMQRIENPALEFETRFLPGTLIERASVRRRHIELA